MLTNLEIVQIKEELYKELKTQLRSELSAEITGASGRILKKILRILSLNLGVELKLPKDGEK